MSASRCSASSARPSACAERCSRVTGVRHIGGRASSTIWGSTITTLPGGPGIDDHLGVRPHTSSPTLPTCARTRGEASRRTDWGSHGASGGGRAESVVGVVRWCGGAAKTGVVGGVMDYTGWKGLVAWWWLRYECGRENRARLLVAWYPMVTRPFSPNAVPNRWTTCDPSMDVDHHRSDPLDACLRVERRLSISLSPV